MNKFQWKQKASHKGIDPNKAVKELERIEKLYGCINAETIVNESRKKSAVLHTLFEWDNTKAAENWRIHQARQILNNIEVVFISDGEERVVDVFEVVKIGNDNTYKAIMNFNSEDVRQIKANSIITLNYWKNKLSFYKEFEVATQKIQDAIEFLER